MIIQTINNKSTQDLIEQTLITQYIRENTITVCKPYMKNPDVKQTIKARFGRRTSKNLDNFYQGFKISSVYSQQDMYKTNDVTNHMKQVSKQDRDLKTEMIQSNMTAKKLAV